MKNRFHISSIVVMTEERKYVSAFTSAYELSNEIFLRHFALGFMTKHSSILLQLLKTINVKNFF